MAHRYSNLINVAVKALVFDNCLLISQFKLDLILIFNHLCTYRLARITVFAFTYLSKFNLLEPFVFFLFDSKSLIEDGVSNLLIETFLLIFPVLVVNFCCENTLKYKYHEIKSPDQCK